MKSSNHRVENIIKQKAYAVNNNYLLITQNHWQLTSQIAHEQFEPNFNMEFSSWTYER